jgi:formyl-CoA transferase
MYVLLTGSAPPERELRAGDGHSTTKAGPAFHECYRAMDGWFYVQADLSAQWERLAREMGGDELLNDPRFATESDRSDHRDELGEMFSGWLAAKTKEEAFDILGGAGVPCSPAYTLVEVAHHPYLKERGMLQEINDPRLGPMLVLSPRIRYVGEPSPKPSYAPYLGEHNDEVFGDLLGVSPAELAELHEGQTI